MSVKDIEELYVGNFAQNIFEGQAHMGPALLMRNGIKATHIESACASGGFALHEAFRAVKGGFTECAMVVGVEKMSPGATPEVSKVVVTAGDAFYEVPSGITFPGYFALMADHYLNNLGGTRDDLAEIAIKNHEIAIKNHEIAIKNHEIAIKNHHHASRNPYAQFQSGIDKEKYYSSPMVAETLCLYDCSPIADGAAQL